MRLYENINKVITDNKFIGWDNLMCTSARILKNSKIVRMYLLYNLDDIKKDEYVYIKETHFLNEREMKIIWEGTVYSRDEILNMKNIDEIEEDFWDKVLRTFA